MEAASTQRPLSNMTECSPGASVRGVGASGGLVTNDWNGQHNRNLADVALAAAPRMAVVRPSVGGVRRARPAPLLDARGYRGDLGIRVGPYIFGIRDQPIDRPALDLVRWPRSLISGGLARAGARTCKRRGSVGARGRRLKARRPGRGPPRKSPRGGRGHQSRPPRRNTIRLVRHFRCSGRSVWRAPSSAPPRRS